MFTNCQTSTTTTVLDNVIDRNREYWTVRNGVPVKRFWCELSAQERAQVIEEQKRQAYCTEFAIY